jgi:hypothetical protein
VSARKRGSAQSRGKGMNGGEEEEESSSKVGAKASLYD